MLAESRYIPAATLTGNSCTCFVGIDTYTRLSKQLIDNFQEQDAQLAAAKA
jgi:hypothetical protein